jgi:hypothetical protein
MDLGSRLLAEFKPLLFNGHQKKKCTIEKRIKYFEEKNFFSIIYSTFFLGEGGGGVRLLGSTDLKFNSGPSTVPEFVNG